jgi:hypothetical protein
MCLAEMLAGNLDKIRKWTHHTAKPDIQDAHKLIPHPGNRTVKASPGWARIVWTPRQFLFAQKTQRVLAITRDHLNINVIITCTKAGISKKWIRRQLDDIPVVSPQG